MGSRCFSAALQYKDNISIKGCKGWKAKSQVKNFIKWVFALMFALYLMVVMATSGIIDIEHCLPIRLISKGLRNYQFPFATVGRFFISRHVWSKKPYSYKKGNLHIDVICHMFKSTFRYLPLSFMQSCL